MSDVMKNINVFRQDGQTIIHKKTDPNAALQSARLAREIEAAPPMSDTWHVGRIDAHVLEKWVKDAGVKFTDREAVKEVIRKKLLDGDNAAFRVKGGHF